MHAHYTTDLPASPAVIPRRTGRRSGREPDHGSGGRGVFDAVALHQEGLTMTKPNRKVARYKQEAADAAREAENAAREARRVPADVSQQNVNPNTYGPPV